MSSMSDLAKALAIIDEVLRCFHTDNNNTHVEQSRSKMTGQISKAFGLSPLGRSALFMAAGRAVESSKPANERAFYDPYAHLFADSLGQKYLKKMSKYAVSYIKHRTLYIDQHITNIINTFKRQRIEIVILGVGCDARSHRMQCIMQNPNVSVYELDLRDVIEYRHNVLIQQNSAHTTCKANVIPIAVDFRNDEWIQKLLQSGYDKQHCNIWIAEGLFPFLTKTEINRLLENIQSHFYGGDVDDISKHWLIGNFLNKNTMLQSKLNKLNKQNGDTTCKTGYSRPHLLLEKYGYLQWEIQPVGSLNKEIKTYAQYLQRLDEQQQPQNGQHVKADHFAKSFMFCAKK